MHPGELAGITSVMTKAGDDLPVIARMDLDRIVFAISQLHETLFKVARYFNVPHRAIAEHLWHKEQLLYKRTSLVQLTALQMLPVDSYKARSLFGMSAQSFTQRTWVPSGNKGC